jgi:ornithine--oxo-acid transaminase
LLSSAASSRVPGPEEYPIVIARGSGSRVWDTVGREYLDFASCNSPLGHAHPELTVALATQAAMLASTPMCLRAQPCEEAALVTAEYFGYAQALLFDSHAGAAVVARHIARALYLAAETGVIRDTSPTLLCASSENLSPVSLGATRAIPFGNNGFGSRSVVAHELHQLLHEAPSPAKAICFDDLDALEEAVSRKSICAFQVEPVQIDAGVVLARDAYMRKVVDICRKHNVPVIADERRTGLGRTGRLLFCDHDGGVKPDMVLLGSALTGGLLPSSCLLLSKAVAENMGDVDTQFAMPPMSSPMASSVVVATLDAFKASNLCENAEKLGADLRRRLRRRVGQQSMLRVGTVRGRGLLNALVFGGRQDAVAQKICLAMAQEGLLANSEQNVIFLTPPLVITEGELKTTVSVIKKCVRRVLDSNPLMEHITGSELTSGGAAAQLGHGVGRHNQERLKT